MALSTVLFSSSSTDFRPQEFVKNILKVSELPEPKLLSDSIESYEWSFETKYYSATVHLCTTDIRTIGDKDFAQSVQAFIHFFDPSVPSSFELAKAWLPYLSHIEPEILMLVCNTSRNSDAVARKVALEWCIQNAFELVELNPEQDSGDEDDDFPETTGLARIVQALHAHTWPNLDMKNSPIVQSSYLRHMMKEQHLLNKQYLAATSLDPAHSSKPDHPAAHSDLISVCEQSNSNSSENLTKDIVTGQTCQIDHSTDAAANGAHEIEASDDKSSAIAPDLEDLSELSSIDWKTLLADDSQTNDELLLSGGLAGVDEFEQLFMKLKVMKDKAESLPPDQRKKYAEKVAVSFWKAIGGDEDEIDGLDEDSDKQKCGQ